MAKATEVQTGVFLVHSGKDYEFQWEDLNLPVDASVVSDADLLAAVEAAADLKAGSLANSVIKRPATGRVLISGRASLG